MVVVQPVMAWGFSRDTCVLSDQVLKVTPCIGDGDTGYGNAVNVKRTVKGYAQVRLTQ